jgi:hypothetical protein
VHLVQVLVSTYCFLFFSLSFFFATDFQSYLLGSTNVHLELEQLVARFVGKEEAVVYGMGYGTNSTTLPILVGKVRGNPLILLLLLLPPSISSATHSLNNRADWLLVIPSIMHLLLLAFEAPELTSGCINIMVSEETTLLLSLPPFLSISISLPSSFYLRFLLPSTSLPFFISSFSFSLARFSPSLSLSRDRL